MARREFLVGDVDQLEQFLIDQRERLRAAARQIEALCDRVPAGLGLVRPPALSASDDPPGDDTSEQFRPDGVAAVDIGDESEPPTSGAAPTDDNGPADAGHDAGHDAGLDATQELRFSDLGDPAGEPDGDAVQPIVGADDATPPAGVIEAGVIEASATDDDGWRPDDRWGS